MLSRLIKFSIDSAWLILMVAVGVVGVAAYRINSSPVEIFPELNAPSVTVMTEAGGLTADEVESYVTFPVESAMNGIPGVRRVRSSSALGLSFVWVEFDWNSDLYNARQMVSERLATAREALPDDIHAELTPMTSLAGEIMLISLSNDPKRKKKDQVSPLDMRAFAEFELRNRLLAVPGISQVVAIGGELPEYQINVNQELLLLYDMTVTDVYEAAMRAHSTSGAGYLTNFEGKEIPLRQTGRIGSIDDITDTMVKYHKGAPVTIGDIAEVTLSGALKRGTASEAGHEAVVLSIQKAPYMNTLEVTRGIDEVLDQMESALPTGVILNRHVMRQSDFINRSITNLMHVLRDAAIFVIVVLILFLMNVRTTIITLTALPLSIAMALLALEGMGETINVMTLGGLAVAIGELVDDAIIDVENVFRRLKENMALPVGERKSHSAVVLSASNEIRTSVVFATLIIVIVFVPLLYLQGLEGRFFRPLGMAYIAAILASLLVALTVTPALCRLLLRAKVGSSEEDSWLLKRIKHVYRPFLSVALRHAWVVLALSVVAAFGSLGLASTFGRSFLPDFNEGIFSVFLMAPPGTSLEESNRLAIGVERQLSDIEGVLHVVRRTGRAERDEHADPVSSSEIEVSVEAGYPRVKVRRAIDEILEDIPGITTMIDQPIQHRLSHFLSGTKADLAINVFGEDLESLRAVAKELEKELKQLDGATDVNAQREVMIESLPIKYRPKDLARWGLTPVSAAEQIEIAFSGRTVAEVNDGTQRIRLLVRLAPDSRERIEQVEQFILRGEGGFVRVSEVADVGLEMTSNLISRENGFRKAVVSVNVAEGHNLGHLVTEVEKVVDPIVARYGYSVSYGGQFEAQQSATKTLLLTGSGTLILILFLLVTALKSVRAALLVMLNLPLALIGGILAIFFTASDEPIANLIRLFGPGAYEAPVISVASMVGFITLFGIAVRNGILLVNHYTYLLDEEGRSLKDTVIIGTMERLAPILMTALTAVLGLIPLALAAGEPGSELLAPLAIVVLGGLVTSTVLNLFVIPAGYWLIFKKEKS